MSQNRLIVQLYREKSYPKRLAAADRLVEEGDLSTACLIFERIALSMPRSEFSETAKTQLRQLQNQVRQEIKTVDEHLEGITPSSDDYLDQVAGAFQRFDDLKQKYWGVPVVNQELNKHAAKLRRNPTYVVVLSEAEARRLWTLGQRYENEESLCCAHEVYADASALAPAETAKRATLRLHEIDRDSTLANEIGKCRKLQVCNEKFQVAETLKSAFPEEADAQYRWILENAPHDSRVFIASADRLKKTPVTP